VKVDSQGSALCSVHNVGPLRFLVGCPHYSTWIFACAFLLKAISIHPLTRFRHSKTAIQFLQQQLAIVREIGDRLGEGNALCNMSLALDQMRERTQAIHHGEQALTIFDHIEDPNAAQMRAELATWREQTDT
jgi:hypothetical protein